MAPANRHPSRRGISYAPLGDLAWTCPEVAVCPSADSARWERYSPDYSRSSSRGAVSRGRCEEKDDMAAQHIGEYVSKDMAFFDEAGDRLTAPQ